MAHLFSGIENQEELRVFANSLVSGGPPEYGRFGSNILAYLEREDSYRDVNPLAPPSGYIPPRIPIPIDETFHYQEVETEPTQHPMDVELADAYEDISDIDMLWEPPAPPPKRKREDEPKRRKYRKLNDAVKAEIEDQQRKVLIKHDNQYVKRRRLEDVLDATVENAAPDFKFQIPITYSDPKPLEEPGVEIKPWGYPIHQIENLGPYNTLSTEHLKAPVGTPEREVGQIAYDHDMAYQEALDWIRLTDDKEYAAEIREDADAEMYERLAEYRANFSEADWRAAVSQLFIGTKLAIDKALSLSGHTLYDGQNWFAKTSDRKRIRG